MNRNQIEKFAEEYSQQKKQIDNKQVIKDAYSAGYKRMYHLARKAFCKYNCDCDVCPQLQDDIECGGGLVVSCDKFHKFVEILDRNDC